MKRRLVKNGLVLAAAALIVGVLAIVVVAWIKGGVQPTTTVEIPVQAGPRQAAAA